MNKIISFTNEELDLLRIVLSKQIWVKETCLSLAGESLSSDKKEDVRDDIQLLLSVYRKL